nr:MAG: transferase hexapeptide protein [Bacteriophage sp.]
MITFTDKELIKEIKERIGSLDVRDNIERRAYEIALASLESEPVAWADNEELLDIESIGCGYLLPYPPNKDVDPCRVIPLYRVPSTQIAPEAIENAIEYIRCIAFHINEDDYHGKHIAHFMRQALTWLEGDSYRDGNCPVTLDAWISCSEQMPDDGRIQFSVSLPAACGGDKYFIDGVFQPLRYERDCEKAVVAAGGVVNWVK